MSAGKPRWNNEPTESDLQAACDYLSLCGEYMINGGRSALGPLHYKAKDILRAARLPLLPKKNPNVTKHLDKWQAGRKTDPVLLRIREGADARPLEVADGYHRVCAAYWVDENTEVRCFIV